MQMGSGRYRNQGNEHMRRECWGSYSNIPPSQRAANGPTDRTSSVVLFQKGVSAKTDFIRQETYHQVLNNLMFIEEPFLEAGFSFSNPGNETQSRLLVYLVPDYFLGSFFRYIYPHVLKHVRTVYNECHLIGHGMLAHV